MSDNEIRDELLNLLYPKNNEKRIVYMRIKSRKHTVKFIELEKVQYYNRKNIYKLNRYWYICIVNHKFL